MAPPANNTLPASTTPGATVPTRPHDPPSQSAKTYFEQHQISQLFECLVAGLAFHQPTDPLAYLHECLDQVARRRSQSGQSHVPLEWDIFVRARGGVAAGGIVGVSALPALQTKSATSKKSSGNPSPTSPLRPSVMNGGHAGNGVNLPPLLGTPVQQVNANTNTTNNNTTTPATTGASPAAAVPIGVEMPALPHTLPLKSTTVAAQQAVRQAHMSGLGGASTFNSHYLESTNTPRGLSLGNRERTVQQQQSESAAATATAAISNPLPPIQKQSASLTQRILLDPLELDRLRSKKIVFVLGPPGGGKGTICAKLVQEFHYTHLSAGDLLRAEVARGSDLGQQLDAWMKEGQIVPMAITLNLLQTAIMQAPHDTPGFLIDGFPREMSQAIEFEKTVLPCTFVLCFECNEALLEARLLKRGETSGRVDDNAETIKKRFRTYQETSYPVVQYYKERNLVRFIESDGSVEEVYALTRPLFVPESTPDSEQVHEQGHESQVDTNPLKTEEPLPADTCVVFVLGGPGSGKGTQCANIVRDFGYKHLSSGDLLREQVAQGTELGRMADALMKEGKMVPTDLTLALLRQAILQSGSKRLLIDGFPRTMDQAIAFEQQLVRGQFVLYYACDEMTLVQRLLKRGETSGRADDNAETIKKRIRTFMEATMPVIEYFEREKRVRQIEASQGTIEQVYEATRVVFEELEN